MSLYTQYPTEIVPICHVQLAGRMIVLLTIARPRSNRASLCVALHKVKFVEEVEGLIAVCSAGDHLLRPARPQPQAKRLHVRLHQ